MITVDNNAPLWVHLMVRQINSALVNAGIMGGTIDGAVIGGATPAAGTFTTLTQGGGTLITASAALTNGAAAQVGTLNNAPAAGNPTKWVPISDNGTTRYVPAW